MFLSGFNPFTAINCNALSAHVTRWRFLNCDSYLGTALCLCSGRFSAEARGTKMFFKAVLYPGLLLFCPSKLELDRQSHHSVVQNWTLAIVEDSVSVITTS